jgi:hypothetical protein
MTMMRGLIVKSINVSKVFAMICLSLLIFSVTTQAQEGTASPTPVADQPLAAVSDSQAIAVASASIAALTGSEAIQDVTLTGNVTWTAGSSDTGTITLQVLGTQESRLDLVLSDGTRTEIRDGSTGTPKGEWIGQDGKTGQFALANAMTDPVWFFPALGSLAAGKGTVLSYEGQENRNGESVIHLKSHWCDSTPCDSSALQLQQLSVMDFYLDATSLLPVAVVFDQHPDVNSNNVPWNIPVEVKFSDYQAISGVQVPTHIEKSVGGAPRIDIHVTGATFNSGLTLSAFSTN